MIPPIYTTLQASSTVRGIFGARPRIFEDGEAPQGVATPYATWLVVSGVPENSLGESPSIERQGVQIDVWAATQAEATAGAEAIRDQMETVTHMTAWRSPPRDESTRRFRRSMDFDYWLPRES